MSVQAEAWLRAGSLLLPPRRELGWPDPLPLRRLYRPADSPDREIILIYFDNTGYFTNYLF